MAEEKKRFPILRRIADWAKYAKKALAAGTLGGAAGAGATISAPDVTGLPWWVNALIAAITAFLTTWFPTNGPKPDETMK